MKERPKKDRKQPPAPGRRRGRYDYVPGTRYEEKKSYANVILIAIVVLILLYLLYKWDIHMPGSGTVGRVSDGKQCSDRPAPPRRWRWSRRLYFDWKTDRRESHCLFFISWDTMVLPWQGEELLRSFKQFIPKGIIVTLIETKFRYIIDLLTI